MNVQHYICAVSSAEEELEEVASMLNIMILQSLVLTMRLNVNHSTFAQCMELENYFICVWCLNFECSTAEDLRPCSQGRFILPEPALP